MKPLRVEFCGEWFDIAPEREFFIGRESDLAIDENPYLHRRFLRLSVLENMWWLTNTGTMISATVSDPAGAVQAWLAPGAALPIVFRELRVLFTAGPTTYDFTIHSDSDFYDSVVGSGAAIGTTTISPVALSAGQRLLVIALCEPMLRREAPGRISVPSAADVSARLRIPLTTYNRKLDAVCEKLDRAGVPGLRGARGKLASQRRDRLVEYAVTSRLVGPEDLPLLDAAE